MGWPTYLDLYSSEVTSVGTVMQLVNEITIAKSSAMKAGVCKAFFISNGTGVLMN